MILTRWYRLRPIGSAPAAAFPATRRHCTRNADQYVRPPPRFRSGAVGSRTHVRRLRLTSPRNRSRRRRRRHSSSPLVRVVAAHSPAEATRHGVQPSGSKPITSAGRLHSLAVGRHDHGPYIHRVPSSDPTCTIVCACSFPGEHVKQTEIARNTFCRTAHGRTFRVPGNT